MHTASRYHDISCGHRVVGHEGKCQFLHGHNYRIHFFCRTDMRPTPEAPGGFQPLVELDAVGRVVDFGVIKSTLCEFLERYWDHRMLLWEHDPLFDGTELDEIGGIVKVTFNPTAENMARYLVEEVGPSLLPKGIRLVKVTIEETAKCSASYEVDSE